MGCSVLAAVLIACMGVPDTSRVVTVPRKCVSELSRADQIKAQQCAAERGIRWRLGRRNRRGA